MACISGHVDQWPSASAPAPTFGTFGFVESPGLTPGSRVIASAPPRSVGVDAVTSPCLVLGLENTAGSGPGEY